MQKGEIEVFEQQIEFKYFPIFYKKIGKRLRIRLRIKD